MDWRVMIHLWIEGEVGEPHLLKQIPDVGCGRDLGQKPGHGQ